LFYTHTKNIINTTAAKQLLLCSQKCPEHSVCATDPHSSASVEALMKPQLLNRERSLAGVRASCRVVSIRSYFGSVPVPAGRGTAFSLVRKTALASSQIILIPSLCPLCLSTRDCKRGLDSGNITSSCFCMVLSCLVLCFDTEYLE